MTVPNSTAYCRDPEKSFDDVCSEMRDEMLNADNEKLKPIVLPNACTDTASTEVAEAGQTENEAAPPRPDNSLFDNTEDRQEDSTHIGLLMVKSANRVIAEASRRPTPKKLFGQLWFEGELCILFADTNTGKSILAVEIADAISSGRGSCMGLETEANPQAVLYVDFELSDKQFEVRYMGENGKHYPFSENLKRVEINSDIASVPEQYDSFEDYLIASLEQVVMRIEAKVVIIDNLTYLSRETEKAKDALPLMKTLKAFGKKYGLSILVLAHTPKRNLSMPITQNDLQGSKMLINFCDGCFTIGESTKGKSLRYIKEIKQRNVPFKYDSENVIECEICKPDNFLQFRFVGYGRESEHLRQIGEADREELVKQVKELNQQGKSQREIAQMLKMSVGCVNNYLKKY